MEHVSGNGRPVPAQGDGTASEPGRGTPGGRFTRTTSAGGPPQAAPEGPAGRRPEDSAEARAEVPAAGPAGTRIDLDDVSRRYRVGTVDVTALDDVDLHVDENAFVVVLGPSGSGKTTLLNLIGALDAPTSGRIRIAGQDITAATPRRLQRFRRSTVSFVFQSFNLFPGLTALENVQFGADVAEREHAAELAADTLAQVGLGDRLRHFPHELSGGEQQRVAIARALATGNPVLLADEPTGELDFRTGVQILGLLRAQAEAGKTVLVVTHNREISRVADRVIELSSGRIVGDGPPRGGRADVSELHW
ncbi:ABC transporter ATP-binding protein [Streptomyces sp. GC420]|uniref:ABC transporter ATP-binding protein n=1 Tax=Streptomyces sp. GC420 TaxID=2697568 RepID=UPI0014150835|nr:ABC transporter ATP-binding protein [Streptomyces sp. GC420]NBM17393.1 ATP-binding cassette domain-containing protein [Streptomyces sp. GC420]